MQIPNLTEMLFTGIGIYLLKIPILILIFIYMIFLVIVIGRLKAFGRTVQVSSMNASKVLERFVVIQLILTLSLFVATIVIV